MRALHLLRLCILEPDAVALPMLAEKTAIRISTARGA